MYVYYHDKNYYNLSTMLLPCLQKAAPEGELHFYGSLEDASHSLSSIKELIDCEKVNWPVSADERGIIDELQIINLYEEPYHMSRLESHGVILVEEEVAY